MQSLRRESVARQHQAEDLVAAASQHARYLRLRAVVQSLGDQVPRERETVHRVVGDRSQAPDRLLREQLLDDRRIEVEILDVLELLVLLGDRGRDGETDLLVRQLDRQLQLLRRVHWVQRQRALRLAQRGREIAEVRQREAHVVVSFGELGLA